ncbi:MAG: ergosterol biosynthesis protein, partial [Acidobacteria bacterium]|nr:ergosterol biosynthesis protein [Acidobacteriota bacterium]
MTGRLIGFFAPWAVFAGILALHLVLPARRVAGYVRDGKRGARLRYRLNGPLVFVVTVGAWFAAGWSGVMPWDWLWQHRWPGAAGAMTLGLVVSALVVLTAPGAGGNLLRDLYLGRRVNPQPFGGRADAKMFLYLAGAVLLEL